MKRFRLSYTMTIDLTAKVLDLPETATAANVEALIKDAGGWVRVLRDWDLHDDAGRGHVFEVEEPDLARKPSGDM